MVTELIDQHGRKLDYLRLSVTDRCNFRCYYCMPAEGIKFAPQATLLTFDEMFTLAGLFINMGVTKIRITGGEPFVRPGIVPFLDRLSSLQGLKEITVTTNGTLSKAQQAALKDLGIRKINISLDSLDENRFFRITRRDRFREVYEGILSLLHDGFEIKLNCVVAEHKNIEDIVPFIELTRDHALAVRFLEEMPFNGTLNGPDTFLWDHVRIMDHIWSSYPSVIPLLNGPHSTSVNYQIDGYRGSFGVIPSFSRTFCGTCNRIRLSANGELRTCLYGPPVLNLRDILRGNDTMASLEKQIQHAVRQRAKNGFEAEKISGGEVHTSMSVLGG